MNRNRSGFTLVELSLSIAFISILSITIVVIINDMILSYQKGLVLKQVNTVGSELIDDLRNSIASSSTNNLKNVCPPLYSNPAYVQKCQADNAYHFVYASKTADVKIGDNSKVASNAPVFGIFCSGQYSYIWNSGYFFDNTYSVVGVEPAKFSYYKNDSAAYKTTITDFRLLKVLDPSRSICINAQKNYYQSGSMINNEFTTDIITSETPVDLLENSTNLAVYDLYISKPAQDQQSQNIFYSGSLILATTQGGINIKASGNYCATPSEYKVENFDYCAINKFNFAMQANGV